MVQLEMLIDDGRWGRNKQNKFRHIVSTDIMSYNFKIGEFKTLCKQLLLVYGFSKEQVNKEFFGDDNEA